MDLAQLLVEASYSNPAAIARNIFGAFFAVALILVLIVYAVVATFLMYLFDKAGVDGKWRAWVPVYNVMIYFKIGDVNPWVALGTLVGGVALSWAGVGYLLLSGFAALSILAAVRISQHVKGEAGWVALYPLPFGSIIWMGIMAFGQDQWNHELPPAAWTDSFIGDKTEWASVPSGTDRPGPESPYVGTVGGSGSLPPMPPPPPSASY